MKSMRIAGLVVAVIVFGAAGCSRKTAPVVSSGRAVADWVADLSSPDAKIRKKAVQSLGHVGTADPSALPAVIGALRDKDASVREAAVLAVLVNGPAARDAIPALTEIRDKDPVPSLRKEAAKAIERIQGTK
jgi:HEAT repeat protein